ncbi:MAG: alpha/beta hydrolase [Spirochaetota bacterium]
MIIWKIAIVAAVVILIIALLIVLLAKILGDAFVFPKSKSLEFTYEQTIAAGGFTEEEFQSYQFESFSVPSDFGYTLRGVYQRGSDPRKTVVFAHGHTWSWHGQVKYFPLYTQRGYTIIAYNHRFHGDSGGPNCTAGYFEKHDLQNVVAWARKQFPETQVLGIMGESMGAATALQYMPLDTELSFVHADCPYSDMYELYDYQLKRRWIPKPLRRAILARCRTYLLKKAQFDLLDVSPQQAIMQSPAPLLLIHGAADRYVPTEMSRSMFHRRKDTAPTTLALIPEATHAQAYLTAPAMYKQQTDAFLNSVEQTLLRHQAPSQ